MRWRRVGAVAAAVGVVTAAWWAPPALRRLRFFEVRRVEAVGLRYLTAEQVVVALGLGPTASVFDDLDELEARLRLLPGVERASVGRRLPGTLVVEAREVDPVALGDGPEGLVALGPDGSPLAYDVTIADVDAPLVRSASRVVVEALAQLKTADVGLFAAVATARMQGGDLVLDVSPGRVRLGVPLAVEAVRGVAAVRRDLAERGTAWRELDGRFAGWVVVRRAGDRLPATGDRTRTPPTRSSVVGRRSPSGTRR